MVFIGHAGENGSAVFRGCGQKRQQAHDFHADRRVGVFRERRHVQQG